MRQIMFPSCILQGTHLPKTTLAGRRCPLRKWQPMRWSIRPVFLDSRQILPAGVLSLDWSGVFFRFVVIAPSALNHQVWPFFYQQSCRKRGLNHAQTCENRCDTPFLFPSWSCRGYIFRWQLSGCRRPLCKCWPIRWSLHKAFMDSRQTFQAGVLSLDC